MTYLAGSSLFSHHLLGAVRRGCVFSSMCRDRKSHQSCAAFVTCIVCLIALPYTAAIKLLVKSQQVECVSHTIAPEQVQVRVLHGVWCLEHVSDAPSHDLYLHRAEYKTKIFAVVFQGQCGHSRRWAASLGAKRFPQQCEAKNDRCFGLFSFWDSHLRAASSLSRHSGLSTCNRAGNIQVVVSADCFKPLLLVYFTEYDLLYRMSLLLSQIITFPMQPICCGHATSRCQGECYLLDG
jgi:hypothetical protein